MYGVKWGKKRRFYQSFTYHYSYELQIKAVDNAIYSLDKQMEGMAKGSEEYRNALRQQNEMFKQRISLVNGATEANNGFIGTLGQMGGIGGSALGQQVVQSAEQYLGKPYAYGGNDPNNGIDCSGLVQYVYNKVGIALNRTSQDQFQQGTPVSKAELQPGDLVFFKGSDGSASAPGHVAIYAGGGNVVEARGKDYGIVNTPLDSKGGYVGARRIVSGGSSTSSGSSVTPPSGGFGSRSEFIKALLPYAMSAKSKYGTLPSLLIAQGIQESDGQSNEARTDNNYFGMMWTANSGKQRGNARPANEGGYYVHYNNIAESVLDYAKLLSKWGATGNDFGSALNNLVSHGYAADPNYKNAVQSIYTSHGLSKYDTGNYPTADLMDTSQGEIEGILGKNEDYVKQNLDFNRKIIENNTKIYEDYLLEFDNKTAHVQKNLDKSKERYDLERGKPTEYDNSERDAEQVWKEINWKAIVLKNKEEYIRSQMSQNIYDKATLAKMQTDLEEVQLENLKNQNELHKYFSEWINNRYEDAIKTNKNRIEMLQSQKELIEEEDTKNYTAKSKITQEILDQELIKRQKINDEIVKINELIGKEKYPTTMTIWLEEQDKFNKELIDSEKNIAKLRQEIEDLKLDEKLKKANDEIEKINNQLSLMEDSQDHFKFIVENLSKVSDLLEKQNVILKESIELEMAKRDRLTEGSEEYLKYQDRINEKEKKANEIKKQAIDAEKKKQEETVKLITKELEKSFYDGLTERQWENANNQKINALKQQLENLDKQDDKLAEQEDRQKRLLELEQLKIQLQKEQDNLNVQQLTKNKDGNWQFNYVADQNKIDDLEKQLRDRAKDNAKQEKELDKKHKKNKINDEIEALENQSKIRKEALDTIKNDLEEALKDEKDLFANGNVTINNIVNNGLTGLNKLYDNKFNDIIKTLQDKVSIIKPLFEQLNPNFVDTQKNIENIQNQKFKASERQFFYGTGADKKNMEAIYGDLIEYVDTSTMSQEDKRNLRLRKGDYVGGGNLAKDGLTDEYIGEATRVGGSDRRWTARKMFEQAYRDNKKPKIKFYASGADLENTKALIENSPYKDFIELVDIVNTPRDKIKLSSLDVMIGGAGVTQQISESDIRTMDIERIWGKNRQETSKAVQKWFDDFENIGNRLGNILSKTDYKKNIYASGNDLKNSRDILGDYVNYTNIAKPYDPYNIQRGDSVIGGKAVTGALTEDFLNYKGINRYLGKDSEETAQAVRDYQDDIINGVIKKNIYASGKDLQNAFKQFGHSVDYVDISKNFDINSIRKGDIVLGGKAVTGKLSDDVIKRHGMTRYYGQTSEDTLNELIKHKQDVLKVEDNYAKLEEYKKRNATDRNKIIVKSANDNEVKSFQVGGTMSLNAVTSAMDGINDVTYDKMGNMVITVRGKVSEAISAIQELMAAQAQAGMGGGSINTNIDTRPVIFAHGSDAKILEAQYGDNVIIKQGTGFSGQGKTRYETNSMYKDYLARMGVMPNHDVGDLYKFDTGGETGDWNGNEGRLAILHKKERVLNAEQSKSFSDLVYKQLPNFKNMIPNISSVIQRPIIKNDLSDLKSILNNNSNNKAIKQEVKIEAKFPDVKDCTEIEKAFDNLVNGALQYAYSNN